MNAIQSIPASQFGRTGGFMVETDTSKPVVLVVDDTPFNIDVLRGVLSPKYTLKVATNGEKALTLARSYPQPELILLDVMMPGMDGYEVCRRLKSEETTRGIPVVFVTSMSEVEDEQRGFEAGGVDYITKPVSPPLVQARVVTHLKLHAHERQLTALVKARTRELEATRLEIIRRLGRAAEFKDDETGQHVIRMSHYARLLAEDEWKVMRKHPAIGAGIIGRHDHPLLHTARIVALTHHEKWDGTGYPRGLAGDKIPLTGRIVAIADVFDALTSERPYKEAWPVARAVDYLRSNAGSHFDPTLVELFIGRLDDVMKVRAMYVDQPGAATLESYAADVAL